MFIFDSDSADILWFCPLEDIENPKQGFIVIAVHVSRKIQSTFTLLLVKNNVDEEEKWARVRTLSFMLIVRCTVMIISNGCIPITYPSRCIYCFEYYVIGSFLFSFMYHDPHDVQCHQAQASKIQNPGIRNVRSVFDRFLLASIRWKIPAHTHIK